MSVLLRAVPTEDCHEVWEAMSSDAVQFPPFVLIGSVELKKFGSFASSMAIRLLMLATAFSAAEIVLLSWFRRRFKPRITLPLYLSAKVMNDGPYLTETGASLGSAT